MHNTFIIDLLGTEITAEELPILMHPNVGAVILFTHNFTNLEQLTKLIANIRSIRNDIFITIDHEGGNVQRLHKHGFRELPAARVYGDVFDLHAETGIKLAQKYGEIMASDLLQHDIDVSLAPILDLHNHSPIIAKLDRAFHHDPQIVIELTTAFIQGMHQAGMPSVGKHFPGHGSVDTDSHLSITISDASLDELMSHDLLPFIELIKRNLLDAIMPAHIIYNKIDAHNPAGFSKIWLQDILRQRLNFDGLIISDCLSMTGADIKLLAKSNAERKFADKSIDDIHLRIQHALTAGCDMLILCNQPRTLLLQILDSIDFVQTPESLRRIQNFTKLSGDCDKDASNLCIS